jgi:hypothetical protein
MTPSNFDANREQNFMGTPAKICQSCDLPSNLNTTYYLLRTSTCPNYAYVDRPCIGTLGRDLKEAVS